MRVTLGGTAQGQMSKGNLDAFSQSLLRSSSLQSQAENRSMLILFTASFFLVSLSIFLQERYIGRIADLLGLFLALQIYTVPSYLSGNFIREIVGVFLLINRGIMLIWSDCSCRFPGVVVAFV